MGNQTWEQLKQRIESQIHVEEKPDSLWMLVSDKLKSNTTEFRKFKELIANAIQEGDTPAQLMQKKLLHDFINDQKDQSKKDLDRIVRIAKKQTVLDIDTIKLLI